MRALNDPAALFTGFSRKRPTGSRGVISSIFSRTKSCLCLALVVLYATLLCSHASLADVPVQPAMVTFTWDDGFNVEYTNILPILSARNLVATSFVVTGAVGSQGCLTWPQITALQNAGWEIGSHTRTHPDLRTCTPEQLHDEISSSISTLTTNGLNVYSLCYPSSYYNQAVINETMQYALAAVGQFGYTEELAPAESRDYVLYRVQTGNDLYQMENMVDKAIRDHEWVIFCSHGFENMNQATTTALADYVKSKVDAGQCINVTLHDGVYRYMDQSGILAKQSFYVKDGEPVTLDFRKNVPETVRMSVTGVAATNAVVNQSFEFIDPTHSTLANYWTQSGTYDRVPATSLGVTAPDGNYVARRSVLSPSEGRVLQTVNSNISQGGVYISAGNLYIKSILSGSVQFRLYVHYTDGTADLTNIVRDISTAKTGQWERLETMPLLLDPRKAADYFNVYFYNDPYFSGEYYCDAANLQPFINRASYGSILPYGTDIYTENRLCYVNGTQSTKNPVVTIDGVNYSYNGVLADGQTVDFNIPNFKPTMNMFTQIQGNGQAKITFSGPRVLACKNCFAEKSGDTYNITHTFSTSSVEFFKSAKIQRVDGMHCTVRNSVTAQIGNLSVTPIVGSNSVDINSWQTAGTFYKKFKESGQGLVSTRYIVGNMQPNRPYTITVDGLNDPCVTGPNYANGQCLSDSNGTITFTFTHNYILKSGGNITTDLEKNGNTYLNDLLIVESRWLESDCSEPDWCQGADFDKNGIVNFLDYTRFAGNWRTAHPLTSIIEINPSS